MTPSLGLMVGPAVGGVLFLVCLTVGIWLFVLDDGDGFKVFGGIFIGFGVLSLALVAVFMYPYKKEYHYWQSVNGYVASVNKRLIADGDSMSERFVVKLADGRIRSCDDTRCADLKVGDPVQLECKRAWQFTGTDGWDCNWAGRE